MTQPIDWLAIAPPLVVALAALAVLVGDAFGWHRVSTALSLGGLGAGLLLLLPLRGGVRNAFCLEGGCSYVVDSTTLVFQLLAAGGGLVVVLLSAPGRAGPAPGEYGFLLLASVTGAMTIAAARDLITLVVALELVTLPAIALVGLRTRASRDGASAEAALKFFLVSVVSVAVMLFGVSLVYGVTGSVMLDRIARELAGADTARVAAVGIVLTLVGLAFKVGAVPFHFWVPETYSGAPIPVAAYLSVVSKAAGVVGLVVVLSRAFGPYAEIWSPIVGGIAAITMTVGNLVALRQTDSVRLLAWSSIAQAGFVLVPLGALATARPGVLGATVAYLLIYAVVNLGAFTVVCMTGGGDLDRFRGLFWTDRRLAFALAFFLLALAGLPPGVVGLFGKVVVVQAAVRGEVTWLAVVAALNVAIGLAYYLRWAAMLFVRPRPAVQPSIVRPRRWSASWVALGLVGVLGVGLSVAPELALNVLR